MNRGLLITLLILAASSSPLSGQNADSVIGRVWLQRASSLMNSGEMTDWKSVEEALRTAREYGETGSDSLYIEARLLLAGEQADGVTGSRIRAAHLLLGRALDEARGGDIVPFDDKAVLWSHTALRLKEYRALRTRYRQWPLGHRYNPVLLYAADRADLYLGHREDAAELAVRGESLSRPGEGSPEPAVDLSVLGAAFNGSAMTRLRALAVAAGDGKAIESLESAAGWGPSLDAAMIPWILAGYIDVSDEDFPIDSFGESIRMIRDVATGDIAGVPENLKFDLALIRTAGGSGHSRKLDDGTYVADADYDGFAEEKLTIRGGQPDTRTLDTDQDGVYEWFITYDNGAPLQIIRNEGEMTVNYRTSRYPEVLSVSSREDRTTVDIAFVPGLYSWDPMAGDVLWTRPVGRPAADPLFWESVTRVTARHQFPAGFDQAPETGAATGTAVTFFADGYPVLAREWRYADDRGRFPLWIRELLYEDGRVVAGRRSFRTDPSSGEPVWELYERFESGRMVGLAWDPGMNGSPAYLSDWALERVLEVQVWDVDRDGWMDYRRFLLPDGPDSSAGLLVTEAGVPDLLPWKASDWHPWEN